MEVEPPKKKKIRLSSNTKSDLEDRRTTIHLETATNRAKTKVLQKQVKMQTVALKNTESDAKLAQLCKNFRSYKATPSSPRNLNQQSPRLGLVRRRGKSYSPSRPIHFGCLMWILSAGPVNVKPTTVNSCTMNQVSKEPTS